MGFLTAKQRQNWLYLTATGAGLTQVEHRPGRLPRITQSDWHAADHVLEHPDALVSWVSSHCQPGPLYLILGEPFYQLMLVDVPEVPPEEIDSALRLKAADLISYDLDEATIDTLVLPQEAYRGRLRMAFIIAAMKTPLTRWALALARQGLKLQLIDVDQLQLRNLALKAKHSAQAGLLHLSSDQCRLVLVYNDEMVLSRQFDIGIDNLSAINSQSDSLALEGQDDIQLDSLVLELRRSFDYYESQLGLGQVNEMHLLGWPGDARLAEALKTKLGLRVEMIQVEDHLDLADTEAGVPVWQLPMLGSLFRESNP
ncbi:MAG: hypothetical protein LAT65_03285 [Saccharospirillum sp.]|nr:hypothetical protein [Saccharospirillum sp.]